MAAIKKNSAQSWFQFAIVFLAGITIAMGMFKVPVNMPNIMNYYGVDITQVSLLMSVVGITCLITALPAGGIMQKMGVKAFGIIVIGAGILECLIGALAPNIEVLVASRLLDAVSYGCLSMVSVSIISANFTPEKRGLPNGIWVIWVPIAQLIVAQVANAVVPAFGWQGEWYTVAICQAVALVLFILFVKNPDANEEENVQEAAELETTELVHDEKAGILDGLKEPGPWLLTLCVAGLAFGASIYTGLYPSYLMSPMGAGLDEVTSNNLVSIGSIGGLVGSVLIGWIINRFKPTKRGILMIIVGAVSAVVYAFCFSIPVGFMAVFIFFFAIVSQLSMPIAFAWIPDMLKNPKTLSMATGILMIGANIGGAFGVTIPSIFIDAAGGDWAAALPVVVGLAVFGIVCAVVLYIYVQKSVIPVRPDLTDK